MTAAEICLVPLASLAMVRVALIAGGAATEAQQERLHGALAVHVQQARLPLGLAPQAYHSAIYVLRGTARWAPLAKSASQGSTKAESIRPPVNHVHLEGTPPLQAEPRIVLA